MKNDLVKKISKLNDFLESGRINRNQYDKLLEEIIYESQTDAGAIKNKDPQSESLGKDEAATAKSSPWGCLILLGIGIFIIMISTIGEERNTSPERAAAAAEEKRKGFHCLSGWNGSHEGIITAVKERLRDPDSFEHIETRVAPVEDGQHALIMKYRARNGFGGMNTNSAIGSYSNSTCKAVLVSTG